MNPKHLYQLDEVRHQSYQHQPDHFEGNSHKITGHTEPFQFLPEAPLRFWYNTQKAGYAPHCHSALEVVTPIDQSFTIILGDTSYYLEPGDILLIPSGMLHHYPAPDSGARFFYIFETGFLASIPGASFILPLLNRPVLITNDTYPDIYTAEIQTILHLAEDYWQHEPLWQMQIYADFISFFTLYGRHCMNQASLPAASADKQSVSESLNRLFDYVKDHYSEDITLAQAADLAGYSKYYFARIFKDCTGQTFMDYLRNTRISAAEKLLLDEKVPISSIAFQSGFTSLPTFNRIFRQMKGCAPSEYRSYYAKMELT